MKSSQPVVSFTREYDRADVLPFHSHRRAQLVYAYRGTMTVRTGDASYMVPPQRAVWMPGFVEHGSKLVTSLNQDVFENGLAQSALSSIDRVVGPVAEQELLLATPW